MNNVTVGQILKNLEKEVDELLIKLKKDILNSHLANYQTTIRKIHTLHAKVCTLREQANSVIRSKDKK